MGDVLRELFGQTIDNSKLEFSTIREVIADKLYSSRTRTSTQKLEVITTSTINPSTVTPEIDLPNLAAGRIGASAAGTGIGETSGIWGTSVAGRIGTRIVQLSRTANLGPLLLSDGDTEVEAQCHLGSILATVCVYEGKWQYEATLGTAGIQQIGWAPQSCPFTNESGVGDSPDSYAFDGKRIAKWHDGSFPYGLSWVTGDVIGSCIDLDSGNITYYRNGQSMGVAFTKVRKGVGYFPAISLSFGEKSQFNFGRRPFEYPVEGFSPLQAPPQSLPTPTSNLPYSLPKDSASYLTSCLRALLHMEHIRQHDHTSASWPHEDILITASILFEYLGPLLQLEYYVVDVWYPFLVACMENDRSSVVQLIDWMQIFMEPFEWESCVHFLFKHIGYKCRTTGLVQVLQNTPGSTNISSEDHKHSLPPTRYSFPALALVLDLLGIPSIRNFAMSLDDIEHLLELFITCKQPSKGDLAVLIPFVWWQGGEDEPACDESSFLKDMSRLNAYMRVYEDLVYELILLFTSNIYPVCGGRTHTFFSKWLNYMLVKNKGANRNVVPPGLSSSSVLVNLYFALLRSLFSDSAVTLSGGHLDAFSSLFHKATDPIVDFSRLGGTLGHLQKTVGDVEVAVHKQVTPVPSASLDVAMMDAAVMLYHLGVSSRFKSTAQQQSAVRSALTQLTEAQARMRESEAATSRLDSTASNLIASVVDGLRLMTYSRAVLVGDKQTFGMSALNLDRQRVKQEVMYKKTVFLAELITTLAQGKEFSYLPEYYLESMVDCFHSLRRAVPPLPFTSEPYSHGLAKIVVVLLVHFNDHRIVNPDVRDLLLQSIGALMQYSEYAIFIENLHNRQPFMFAVGGKAEPCNENIQTIMVRGLLQAFDKKYWVTVTSILLRFWKGFGLGQTVVDLPSPVFRNIFKEIVFHDKPLLDTFLNNLFNLLNSTISEFSLMKLDVTQMNTNDFRKANFLFELSINLLRILEFISMEIPQAFLTGESSELNMTRLVELLLLILTRTTLASEATRLDSILILEAHVSRVWILAPLVGVILNLESYSQDSSQALIEVLLADASFKLDAFEYLLHLSWQKVSNTSMWLKKLEDFIGKLRAQQEKPMGTSSVTRSVSMEMCNICYGAPIDTQFEPCKHLSCHKCISRHLLNNTRCFFCNADVASTHPFSSCP